MTEDTDMSDMVEGGCGVCIGGWDGDYPEFYFSNMVTARKPHKCYECGKIIQPKEKYERVTGKWDGAVDTYTFCAICSEIGTELSCDGRMFGNMWEDIRDNLFPNMTTGCLNKLKTAAAKELLVAKWRKWKLQ